MTERYKDGQNLVIFAEEIGGFKTKYEPQLVEVYNHNGNSRIIFQRNNLIFDIGLKSINAENIIDPSNEDVSS